MSKYTDLITSEHADKPNFTTMVGFVTQAYVDGQAVLARFNDAFDLDQAVGAQLDVLGQWIGMGRIVKVPLLGAYFSLDIVGLGLDEGVWFQTGNPLYSSVTLTDDQYRPTLQARALANRIGRSLYDVYSVLDVLFRGTATSFIVHDYGNMSMAFELSGAIPEATVISILDLDYINLRPEGVKLLPTIITP